MRASKLTSWEEISSSLTAGLVGSASARGLSSPETLAGGLEECRDELCPTIVYSGQCRLRWQSGSSASPELIYSGINEARGGGNSVGTSISETKAPSTTLGVITPAQLNFKCLEIEAFHITSAVAKTYQHISSEENSSNKNLPREPPSSASIGLTPK